jgi:alpha-galactosidase
MKQKIVLIGAGSANFGLSTLGDLLRSLVFAGCEICLHDINPAALQRVENFGRNFLDTHGLPFVLSATTNRSEALRGATFCINSIEVGNRFELWDQDWMIPLQFGIRQVYGENGGPGGLFHSLRIIPPILEICEDIMRICPDAWVLNFSNPMSRICTTVHRKFPDLKLVGLCHEIASLPVHLPQILGTPFSNLRFQAGGLNHFSVLKSISYVDSGRDAYPEVLQKAPAYFENQQDLLGWAIGGMPPDVQATFEHKAWAERGVFKIILEKFGYLPITTDSHFGEYIQWAYDSADLQGILDFYRAYIFWCSQQISEERLIQGAGESWNVIQLMEGVVTGAAHEELAVNLPNEGLIDNLPADIVVEVPALVDGSGIHGIPLGRFRGGMGGLFLNQYAVHDLTAEAVLARSKSAALQALLVDPVVTSVRAAEQTLQTMIQFQNRWLGYLH